MKKLLFLLITGCTRCAGVNMDNTLQLASISQIKGYDPIFAEDLYSGKEMARIYEGLLEYKFLVEPVALQANLAAEMPTVSVDNLTVTFKIKPGVFFQDNECFTDGIGRELEASDFVYSIKRLADPSLVSTGWWVLENKIQGLDEWRKNPDYALSVEGLKALDKYTLQFKLNKPYPQFLDTLAMPFTFVVPKEAVAYYGAEFLNHPVGTGPYMLPEFKQSNTIHYKKNPKFREKLYPSEASPGLEEFLQDAGTPLPLVDNVVVNIIEEEQPRWLNFLQGRLDYIAIPKDNFAAAVDNGKLTKELTDMNAGLHIIPSQDLTYLAFNHDHEIFKDKRIRQAISLAYDREESIKLFYSGNALSAQSVIPPGLDGYKTDFKNKWATNDIELAKKLLAEAGFPGGDKFPTIVFGAATDSTTGRQKAEYFKQRMSLIGLNVDIIATPFQDLINDINGKRSFSMWGIAWSADYPDAETFLQLLYGPNKYPGSNGAGYNNDTYNKMFEKATGMFPSAERTKLYEELNAFLAEEMPILFETHRIIHTVTSARVRNYRHSDFNLATDLYLNINTPTAKK